MRVSKVRSPQWPPLLKQVGLVAVAVAATAAAAAAGAKDSDARRVGEEGVVRIQRELERADGREEGDWADLISCVS